MRKHRIAALAVASMLTAVAAAGQEWRGMGRISGKVTDEAGQPLEGVVVKVVLSASGGGTEAKTSRKGEWAIGGIARGEWAVDFIKEGYETRSITVPVSETSRIPPIEIALVKKVVAVDPNEELKKELITAAGLMTGKKYAEARAIYEKLLARHPEAHQLHPLIARTYYAEEQYAKSIEHLRLALEKDADNVEVKLLLGNILVEQGKAEEGRQLLASVGDAQVKDPTTFLNVGIAMLNDKKPAEALLYFDKTIAQFPDRADAYYYRGITNLQTGKTDAARADLTKFVAMAPDAPEADTAKKILAQLKEK